jgi:uncharacterized protein (TIGR01777 family)
VIRSVIAGGSGTLGRRLAGHLAASGHDVVILSRTPAPDARHRTVPWDGRTVGSWAGELEGAIVINLAGALVDRRPTASNIALLTRSRVEPTRALVEASLGLARPVSLWLQMSTLAIYGDRGDEVLTEASPAASEPPQMADVAGAWEAAVAGARTERLITMRTGIVLDPGSPAMSRLTALTQWGLGGRISTGRQWISWIHIDDFLAAVSFLIESKEVHGTVHVCSPQPVRNADMMSALRGAMGRPAAPPTPAVIVRLGAFLMRSDPALALTGRRCHPGVLTRAGLAFEHPEFDDAIADLLATREAGRER